MRGNLPKIEWGNGKTINFGYPLFDINTWSMNRDLTEYVYSQDGTQLSWNTGTHYFMSCNIRWIPTNDLTIELHPGGETIMITGWDGDDGWRVFLEWARRANRFDFFPNRDSDTSIRSWLADTISAKPSLESDFTRKLSFSIRNITQPYDGY